MIDTKSEEEDMGWAFKSFDCRLWFTFYFGGRGPVTAGVGLNEVLLVVNWLVQLVRLKCFVQKA